MANGGLILNIHLQENLRKNNRFALLICSKKYPIPLFGLIGIFPS